MTVAFTSEGSSAKAVAIGRAAELAVIAQNAREGVLNGSVDLGTLLSIERLTQRAWRAAGIRFESPRELPALRDLLEAAGD